MDGVLKLNGPLFSLRSGKLRMAVGAQYRYNRDPVIHCGSNVFGSRTNTFMCENHTQLGCNVQSEFLELRVPVLGGDEERALVTALSHR